VNDPTSGYGELAYGEDRPLGELERVRFSPRYQPVKVNHRVSPNARFNRR
jgi:hypothetical protein